MFMAGPMIPPQHFGLLTLMAAASLQAQDPTFHRAASIRVALIRVHPRPKNALDICPHRMAPGSSKFRAAAGRKRYQQTLKYRVWARLAVVVLETSGIRSS